MARYTGPSCKLCRRERMKLFLKGNKMFFRQMSYRDRNYPPGQHGLSRRSRISDYAVQLREKQKVRKTYGVLGKSVQKIF